MNTRYGIKRLSTIAALIGFMLVFGSAAHAALQAGFGPPAPGTQGFPTWYQDKNGLSLGPCWDYNGFCSLLPPFCPPSLGLGCNGTPINLDPNVAINDNNFPIETFYFDATTVASFGPDLGAKFTQVIALEGSFGTLPPSVQPGQQITFLRINTRVVGAGSLIPNSTYTVVHPYGTYTVTSDANGDPVKVGGAGAFRALDGCAGAPCDFNLLTPATTTGVGPWLVDTAGFHTDAATGNIYIGAGPLSATTVAGSPTGNNFVSITGPCANGGGAACRATPVNSTFRDDFFFLSGKVVGISASPALVVFPPQKAGVTSAPVTVTITNPDAVNFAALGPASKTGANAADFTLAADNCSNNPNIPANGGTCTFAVTFSEPAPGVNGTKSAVVSFPVTTPLNRPPVIINLSGTLDTIAPTVTLTLPADKEPNWPANNVLHVTFSEPVTGVSNTTFTLRGGSPVADVNGVVTLDATNKIAMFTQDPANLQTGQTYTATLTTGITDIAGNPLAATGFSFTTADPDTTPPRVQSTIPANNVTGVRVGDRITATFAGPLDPMEVNGTTFFLSDGVTGTVTYDQATRTAVFTPDKPLEFFHSYTATIKGSVESLGLVPMGADFTWTFFTNGAPSAPSLYLPGDKATDVALPVQFQWVKSKDDDGEAVTYQLWYCTNPGMVGCTPVNASETATTAAGPSLRDTLAGLAGYGAGTLLAGFAIMGGVRTKKKIFFFIAVLAITGMATAACGKKTETVTATPDPATLMTKSVSDLKSATTYWWKIVADDGNGALVESETRSFTTH